MAVLGRLLVSSGERLDLPDLLSIDSYTAGDFQYLLKTFVGQTTPYVIAGFDIINPATAIGTSSCSVSIANAAMYYPGSGAGSFYYGLPAGNPNAQPLVPVLVTNAINYVYLTLTTANTAQDTRAFWDPDVNGGQGQEFTEEVNTESVIQVQVNVSTSAFPENTVPVAMVTVGPSVISSITDARPLMFRLGTGGQSPNPYNRFAWPALPSSSYERTEPPITISSNVGIDPFQGGDKNVLTFKNWMDAVMTKLAELGGTEFWYENATTMSVISTFHDALATTFKSKGQYQYSSATAGLLTWTEDIWIVSVSDPRFYMLRAGNITIPDQDVAYIPLVRAQPFNPLNQAVAWGNGQAYVNTPNGSIGFFANILQGDWVKKAVDDATLFLRVEQFYAGTNATGSTTTPANAKSILLSGAYQGTTATDIGVDDQGVYHSTDISIQARNNIAISNAGGNFMWFAFRGDFIENISSISTVTVSGTVTSATGSIVTVNATAHGLVNGDQITVTAPGAQAGTYTVNIIDVNNFTFNSTNTTTGSFTGFYGLVTTAATTNGFGLQIQNADHGCMSGDTIIVSNTTNYNGNYVVNVRSATQLEFPIGASHATETSGTSTLSIMDVRTEEGITRVVQGQTIDIGVQDSQNIQSYLGMPSLAVTAPTYVIPAGYNTFSGGANYNGQANDNITLRTAQLTAMMMDKAQDKTLQFLTEATSAVNTPDGGGAQQLTFLPASSNLTIVQPGSQGNAVVSLPSTAPGISLLTNQCAYTTINRNSASTPSITVANISAVPVSENVVIIATRLSDANIWLWNGLEVIDTAPLIPSYPALVKVKYFDPISQTVPTGNPVVEDGSNVQAGDLVLFSNLTVGNNQIYMANGTGTNITGWTLQYLWNGSSVPSSADTVIIQEGAAFQDQIGKFNDTTWVFNDKVRYFGITSGASASFNYFEQDAIATTTLNDNTTNGTVYTVSYVGSEYQIVDFSINRGSTRETGTIWITSDGTNVDVTTGAAYIGTSGVTFNGIISGSNLLLRYNTTSTGSSATMKFMIRRWSNASGGPAGVPSYSGASSAGAAGGPIDSIQYNNSGILDGSSSFLLDPTNGFIVLNGLHYSILSSPITITDNTASPATLFSYAAATYPYAVVEYSIVRNGAYRTGRLLIANDGSSTAISEDFVNTTTTGVTISATVSGGNVLVQYTSTSTGFNGTFKYSIRQWS
jgi:hypothetical protein